MKRITRIDQMGRTVLVPERPIRIVSLVPSQTEFLVDLGLSDRIVGLTKFCIHPEGFKREKTIVGGTKNINIEKVRALNPDLIIGNKEENDQVNIEALEKEFPVWMSDIFTLDDAYAFMKMIGEVLDVDAREMISTIQQRFGLLKQQINVHSPKKKVAYVIWNNPVMLAGGNTFIDYLLNFLHFENISGADRYPEVELDQLEQPDFLFLSSEPYPFKEKHVEEFQQLLPDTKIMLVDGEYFSWYGSRLLGAPDYFSSLLNQIG